MPEDWYYVLDGLRHPKGWMKKSREPATRSFVFVQSTHSLSLPLCTAVAVSDSRSISVKIVCVCVCRVWIFCQIAETIKLSRKGGSLHNNSMTFFWRFSRPLAPLPNIVSCISVCVCVCLCVRSTYAWICANKEEQRNLIERLCLKAILRLLRHI